jgi:cation:H+ antiporter
MIVLSFIAGLVFLIAGAEIMIRGASRMASALGVSPLIVGLTVVAFGTSSPELAISIKSAFAGQAGIAVGNVIGSNIFNILFILGLSSLISPLVVSQQLVRLEVPLLIMFSFITLLMALDGQISRVEGAFLFISLLGYIGFLIRQSRRESREVQAEYSEAYEQEAPTGASQYLLNIAMMAAGLWGLVQGSRWLVDSAIVLARYLGLSELIIGLTVIAIGTSLPEVVTSIIAGVRGERDIAVGNVVGSNLFNILGVLGLTSIVAPAGIEVTQAAVAFDLPVMVAAAIACLPVFFSGKTIERWEGILFLGYYVAYTLYLFLAASQHDALPLFSATMLYFVIPLTVLTLMVVTLSTFKKQRKLPAK